MKLVLYFLVDVPVVRGINVTVGREESKTVERKRTETAVFCSSERAGRYENKYLNYNR